MNDDLEATQIPLHDVPVGLVVQALAREKTAVSSARPGGGILVSPPRYGAFLSLDEGSRENIVEKLIKVVSRKVSGSSRGTMKCYL